MEKRKKLDVTIECPAITNTGYYISLDDEIEIKNAKKEGLITDEVFLRGYETANSLMNELKNWSNDLVNRSIYDIFRLKKLIGKN